MKIPNYMVVHMDQLQSKGQSAYFIEIILYFLFTNSKKLHSHISSDFEVTKTRQIFEDMIVKNPKCHEAYFGLAKTYFHARHYKQAASKLLLALKYKHDRVYMLWLGLIYYF